MTRIIFKWIKEVLSEGVVWIHVASEKDQQRALVHTIPNHRRPHTKCGEYLDIISK
jgi:hypothetical protein